MEFLREKAELEARLASLEHLKRIASNTPNNESGNHLHRDDYYKQPKAEAQRKFNVLERDSRTIKLIKIPNPMAAEIENYPTEAADMGPIQTHLDKVNTWVKSVAQYAVIHTAGHLDRDTQKLIQETQKEVDAFQEKLAAKVLGQVDGRWESPNPIIMRWLRKSGHPPYSDEPHLFKAYLESRAWLTQLGDVDLVDLVREQTEIVKEELRMQEKADEKINAYIARVEAIADETLLEETVELSSQLPQHVRQSERAMEAFNKLLERTTAQVTNNLTEGIPVNKETIFTLWTRTKETEQVALTATLIEYTTEDELTQFVSRALIYHGSARVLLLAIDRVTESALELAERKRKEIWACCLRRFENLQENAPETNRNIYPLLIDQLNHVVEKGENIDQYAIPLVKNIPSGISFAQGHITQMITYADFLETASTLMQEHMADPKKFLNQLKDKLSPEKSPAAHFDEERYGKTKQRIHKLRTHIDTLMER